MSDLRVHSHMQPRGDTLTKQARDKKTPSHVSNGRSLISWCKPRNGGDVDGGKKKRKKRKTTSVVSDGVCVLIRAGSIHKSPLRNPCLCIRKSFCCCGCYRCCFQNAETVATTFQISDGRGRQIERVAASLLYDLLPIKCQKWGPGRHWITEFVISAVPLLYRSSSAVGMILSFIIRITLDPLIRIPVVI